MTTTYTGEILMLIIGPVNGTVTCMTAILTMDGITIGGITVNITQD